MPSFTFITRDNNKIILNNIDSFEWKCLEACEDQNMEIFPMNTWCRVKSYHLKIWDELKLIKRDIQCLKKDTGKKFH